ncbi:MAG: hypothetical protein ACI9CO_001757 [Candidatus Azotimanducaceae bacterium]|jgi:hypothetical protein
MTIYSIKVAMRGISPMIWRRLRLPAQTSLADLHNIVQIAMGWDDEYLHFSHIFGKDYGITYVGGLDFSDNPHEVTLGSFGFDIGDRFTYTYNFFDNWLCDIRIEDVQADTGSATPFCTGGQRRWVSNTPCYRGDAALALIEVLDTIFNGDEATTTIGDVRELIDVYESIRFNRSAINSHFAQALEEAV